MQVATLRYAYHVKLRLGVVVAWPSHAWGSPNGPAGCWRKRREGGSCGSQENKRKRLVHHCRLLVFCHFEVTSPIRIF